MTEISAPLSQTRLNAMREAINCAVLAHHWSLQAGAVDTGLPPNRPAWRELKAREVHFRKGSRELIAAAVRP